MNKEFATLKAYAANHEGWIFDTWSGAKSFGGEAIRLLWTLPWFLEFCKDHQSFVNSDPIFTSGVANAKELLKGLVLNILKNFSDGHSPSSAKIDPQGPAQVSGVGGATLLGPLLFALLVLKQEELLPKLLPLEIPADVPEGFKTVLGVSLDGSQTVAPAQSVISYVKKDYMYAMRDQFQFDKAPKIAAQDAYSQPKSKYNMVSPGIHILLEGLSGYTPTSLSSVPYALERLTDPAPISGSFTPHAPTSIKDLEQEL